MSPEFAPTSVPLQSDRRADLDLQVRLGEGAHIAECQWKILAISRDKIMNPKLIWFFAAAACAVAAASDVTGRRLAQVAVAQASSSSSVTVTGRGNTTAAANASAKGGRQSKSNATAITQDDIPVIDQSAELEEEMILIIEASAILAEQIGVSFDEGGSEILDNGTRLSEAILNSNVTSIAEAVEAAFTVGELVGAAAVQIVAEAFAEGINSPIINGAEGFAFVGNLIAAGIVQGGEKAAIFGIIVSALLEKEGCPKIRNTILEADRVTTAGGKFTERAFIEAMNMDERIIKCAYQDCTGEAADCCVEDARSVGKCKCNSEGPSAECKYRLFWQIPRPIWACGFDSPDCDAPKCMCVQG